MRTLNASRAAPAIALSLAAGVASAQFSNFHSFGDSLSDAGSFKPLSPPGTGLYTTNPGPMWTQFLAERYGLVSSPANKGGNGYAEGGARIALNPGFPPSFPPTATATPVYAQIAQLLASGAADPGALYSVWAGGNDLLTQLDLLQAGAITPQQLQGAMTHAASQLVGGVAQLQGAGANKEAVVRQFSEQGSSSTALAYGRQERESLQTSLGWHVAGQLGAVRRFGRVTWEYDALADERSISATPALLGGTYTVGAFRPDDNDLLFNLGASMDFGRATGFVTGAATASKGDGDYDAITVGVRNPMP